MNYAELKADLFIALERKTNWGRTELKSVINDVFLAAADKEIALLDPQQPKDYEEIGTVAWPDEDIYDGDNSMPWR